MVAIRVPEIAPATKPGHGYNPEFSSPGAKQTRLCQVIAVSTTSGPVEWLMNDAAIPTERSHNIRSGRGVTTFLLLVIASWIWDSSAC